MRDVFYLGDKPNAHPKEKYVKNISEAREMSRTELFWIINEYCDYSKFDWDYDVEDEHIIDYVWPSLYSKNSGTLLCSKENWLDQKLPIDVNPLNYKDFSHFNVFYIDFQNNDSISIRKNIEKIIRKKVKTILYEKDYIQTFNAILDEKLDTEKYIWIFSSITDYKNTDLSKLISYVDINYLNVFSNEKIKYGDTFFLKIELLNQISKNCSYLEDYSKTKFNYVPHLNRLSEPVFEVIFDSHVDSVKQIDFNFPYASFHTQKTNGYSKPISLWSNKSKNIIVTGEGATSIIVPKEVKQLIKNELYDYPYIFTLDKLSKANPLDIIFLSNDEDNADMHYEHLLKVTKNKPNKVKRIDGIDGRVKSFHAAAMASQTPWAFIVFAKLKVDESFDFSWQPDRLRKPKHYIFYAKNPLNGLVYGHQSMCAYNKKIVLETTGKELDFTMEGEHDVVDMYSGVAEFNTSPYATWRTAFREAIKLKYSNTEESQHRLNIWLTIAEGDFAEYCILGAKDGVNFYNEVNGVFDKLKLSYEWNWLNEFYKSKYKND